MKELLIQLLKTFQIKPIVFLAVQIVLMAALYVINHKDDFGITFEIKQAVVDIIQGAIVVVSALLSAKETVLAKKELS